jgi:ribosome maturation factor RimP
MGMSLVELSVFRGRTHGNSRNVQVRVVVLSKGITGVEDCSRVHRALLPRLELAFSEQDVFLEVSSPGIDRLIKDGSEFVHFIGRGVRCFRTDISDWTTGILRAADEEKIVLEGESGEFALPYQIIAKARLDGSPGGTGG